MPEILAGLAKEIPSVAALIIIVVVFLKFMSARAEDFNRVVVAHDSVLQKIADRYDDTARQANETAKESSAAIGRVTVVMERLIDRVDR